MLFNQYGAIVVNHHSRPDRNQQPSGDLVQWLSSDEGQQLIGSFTRNGMQLFTPNYNDTT